MPPKSIFFLQLSTAYEKIIHDRTCMFLSLRALVFSVIQHIYGTIAYAKPQLKKYFLISHPKHMLWVLKRIVTSRQFFWEPKNMFKRMGMKIIGILRYFLAELDVLIIMCKNIIQTPMLTNPAGREV